MDLKAKLREAQKPETEKKSTIPILQVDEDTQKLAGQIREAKEQAEAASTLVKLRTDELLSIIAPKRQELCLRNYVSSLKIPTTENLLLTLTWTHHYSKIKPSSEGEIVRVLGQEKYSKYFSSRYVIQAKSDLTDSELEDLVATMGDKFEKYFEVDEQLKPSEEFTRQLPVFDELTRTALIQAGVNQFRPSVKTR